MQIMYKIVKDGAALSMIEAPNYIRLLENGCFTLCTAEEAEGIAHQGTVYHLIGRPDLVDAETITLETVDTGTVITETRTITANNAAITGQVAVAAQIFVKTATTIPDNAAMQMIDLFQTWEQALAAGGHLAGGTIINDGGTLYRVVGANGVDPQAHQPPHGEGMLAVYQPIDNTHAGTLEDPIPWVYGMSCAAGSYYTNTGATWLCISSMPVCVWAPGSTGVWQWEAVE